jgi:hypothetical protein
MDLQGNLVALAAQVLNGDYQGVGGEERLRNQVMRLYRGAEFAMPSGERVVLARDLPLLAEPLKEGAPFLHVSPGPPPVIRAEDAEGPFVAGVTGGKRGKKGRREGA